MYTAFAHLLTASIAAGIFVVLSRTAGAKAFAREKFLIGWVLTVALIVPVNLPLVRLEMPESAAKEVISHYDGAQCGENAVLPAPPEPSVGESGGQTTAPSAKKFTFSKEAAVFALYAAAASGTLFCILYRHCRAVKALRRCGRAPSVKESEIYAQLCEKHGLRKQPFLLVCPALVLGSSVTFGVARQTVIIADKFAEDDFALISEHELMHCKRKDSLLKVLLTLLCSLYWFNPIIHLFIREMNGLCEQSCDEAILKNSGFEEKKRYCRLLVETALSSSAEKKFLFSAFRGGKRIMKRRITNILGKKSRFVTAVAVVTMLLVTALTSAIYIDTPPENIKVAYLEKPVYLEYLVNKEAAIDDYVCDNYYNFEYSYDVDSNEVAISGIVNGKEFDVVGTFITPSYNGARLCYKGEDKVGNYNVLGMRFEFAQITEYTDLPILDHDSGENARHRYSGFFREYSYANPQYKNTFELYLNPVDTDEMVIIEIFLEEDFITDFIKTNNVKCDGYECFLAESWTNNWWRKHNLEVRKNK